jgi:glycosyltransferase involved in cell wall biosynthesis
MNIYIKTFNRPFYLERCLRSLKAHAHKRGEIRVMDDGTLERYRARLTELHPDVVFLRSNADDDKFALLKQQRFEEIRQRYDDPAAFWVRTARAEPDSHFMVMEDDTWLVEDLDLAQIDTIVKRTDAAMLRLHWHMLTTGRERIYYQEPLGPDLTVDFFMPEFRIDKATNSINVFDLFMLWQSSMAIYRRDFYIHCQDKVDHYMNEHWQVKRAAEFFMAAPKDSRPRFAKTSRAVVHQGWIVPARSEPTYYQEGLVQHVYMECLNEAWYAGRLDVAQSLPLDFSEAYIVELFRRDLDEAAAAQWLKWRDDYVKQQAFPYTWYH